MGALGTLTRRWYDLEFHKVQQELWTSTKRFRVVPAGRRSGKTELAKRFLVTQAMQFYAASNGRFIAAAPIRTQAKDIYWEDLKEMVPAWALDDTRRKPTSESELTIYLYNGARIEVRGMDEPARVEGDPIDGIILDEYANMKKTAWTAHVRPGLFTKGRPPGWAWLIGVPEGRNHYYQLYKKAQHLDEWGVYQWKSSDILPQEEVEAAKDELDPLTFDQEYNGSFVTFTGRAYYCFDSEIHEEEGLAEYYDPDDSLIFCFDFNVSPGTAVICQEINYDGYNELCADKLTAVIDEVWVSNHSNTKRICHELIKKYAGVHNGPIECYGDPAGGSRGTAKLDGSDWDIIKSELAAGFPDNQIIYNVPKADPGERPRVNAINSRLLSTNKTIRLLLDPLTAAKTIEDLDGCRLDDNGYIDKKSDPMLTHLSDALAYYLHKRFSSGAKLIVNYQ